jgi:hypothetical protein
MASIYYLHIVHEIYTQWGGNVSLHFITKTTLQVAGKI